MTTDRNTTYLRLRYIDLNSKEWYRDWNYNLQQIDTVGRMLRVPIGAGKTSALRSYLADGTLAEAIRFIPENDIVNIRIGRVGKGDRIYFDAELLFQNVSLSNQVSAYSNFRMSLGATWVDEDLAGDPISNTQLLINTRNNLRTVMDLPPAHVQGITDVNWLGSAAQLECDASGVGTGMHFLKFSTQTSTGTRNFLVPAYLL
jgi:hypothetical protein